MTWGQLAAFTFTVVGSVLGGVWWLVKRYVEGIDQKVSTKDSTIENLRSEIDFLESTISPNLTQHLRDTAAFHERKAEDLRAELEAKEEALRELEGRLTAKELEADVGATHLLATVEALRKQLADRREYLAKLNEAEKATRNMQMGDDPEAVERFRDVISELTLPGRGYFYCLPYQVRLHMAGGGQDSFMVNEPVFPPGSPRGQMQAVGPIYQPFKGARIVLTAEPVPGLEPLNEEQLRRQVGLRGIDYGKVLDVADRAIKEAPED